MVNLKKIINSIQSDIGENLVIINGVVQNGNPAVEGQGASIEQSRAVDPFTAIIIEQGSFELLWEKGFPSIDIQAQQNVLEHVKTEIKGTALHIGLTQPVNGLPIKVCLGSPNLSHISNNGSSICRISALNEHEFTAEQSGRGSIHLQGSAERVTLNNGGSGTIDSALFTASSLSAELCGSGKILAALSPLDKAGTVHAEIQGSGSIELSGSSHTTKLTGNGSGKIRALELNSKHLEAELNGSGSIEASATEEAHADLNGSGKIFISGPATLSSSKNGTGTIRSNPSSHKKMKL